MPVTPTPFTRVVGCEHPIQQAAMGGVATLALARAVARVHAEHLIGVRQA